MKQVKKMNNTVTQNQRLSQLVKFMLIAVIGVSLAFGAFYFWDRYVHLGDMSPIEVNIAHLEKIVQENPSDPGARLSLAQSYIENKRYEAAIAQAEMVLDAYTDHEGALVILGMAYTKSGNFQEALSPLERFVALRQENPDVQNDTVLEASLFYLGQNYLSLNQPEKAVDLLLNALHIDPTDADAMYLLGNAYAQTGQHNLAVDMYQNAVRFVPDFQEAYRDMQTSFRLLNKPEYVIYAQGMEAFSVDDFGLARQLLEQAAQELPEYLPVTLGLALTYEQLGETQLAMTSIQRVLELDPHNFTAASILSRLEIANQ